MEIRHEEFIIILKEKVKYEKMKYILENKNENKKSFPNYNQLSQQ